MPPSQEPIPPEFDQSDPADSSDILDDRMVTPEKSMFGTRLPRPTGVGRHLFVVIILFMLALAMAIVFAERGAEPDQTPEEGDVRFSPPPLTNP
jgi:hypothetical protein